MLTLLLAIVSELLGTMALKLSDGFARLLPTLSALLLYGFAFFLLSKAFRSVPIATAYAIWSGLGTAGIAAIGWAFFAESISLRSVLGLLLICVGTFVLKC